MIRAMLNDLKRNDEAAARELGVSTEFLQSIVNGERAMPQELVARAVEIWPLNERDFFTVHDDAPNGVRIMRAAESEASSRVFQRGGVDYYEYRDTAMSRISTLRPEWIRMLAHVDDDDPENPGVQWNNGHFLYQFTYFFGEVNYYYEWQGKKHCASMETGDSVFGLPYARHSFALRGPEAQGHILALTYGGRLAGDGQHELGALGEELAQKYALSTGTESTAQAALIRSHMEDGAFSVEYVSEALGIPAERLEQIVSGAAPADGQLLQALAEVFRIDVRELYPMLADTENGVVIVRGREAPSWHLPSRTRPSYRVKRLACSRVTSFARSIELEPLDRLVSDHPTFLEVSQHQYGYNHGASPMALSWYSSGRLHQTVITPDDSFYIKPFVPHRFSLLSSAKASSGARVLLLRVGGQLVGDTRLEASVIGAESLHRLVADTTQWYDPNAENRPSSASATR